ncbi:period circadian protein homolog 1 isoform X1 [Bufo gargarizans]|uniref:period circadian protein homolog 1 isoform X1 n=1 Tax=Bufo gargarizans TaxID=30331 RepID=UPI001CF5E072|nr:period circadian protein homolog 1 isoform X1 [Bufo gargarizans]XP_044134811.1 period circadian protein homolog 1 isoform X1 [Bufo gargarizans]XP_044134812.1 period circadian protein homolog 1 isoform X1 [Bufo gargarizans]XP_044134813.1 period circadian protein homolog 1 isoform X1 [Bufo gargarizans]
MMSGPCEPPPPLGERGRRTRGTREMEGTQQDETDTNSHGSSGNESNGNESRQSRSSHSSTSGNGKDSSMLEATESSKSTNSHSPSPPSSSIAYSLLSASSEQDNPSTSGCRPTTKDILFPSKSCLHLCHPSTCSSEQSAREKTQKELMKALKEMKIRLPSEKRGKGKSGTLATLQYALSCVKQVRANQEYYQQWTIDESQPCSLDMSSFTIEEVESVTSEYTLKNPDTFSVAVSFITGRIVYISDQASHILHCKRDVFKGAIFAEFLAPQDVSVFYGSTAPYHLPSWSNCTSGETTSMDYTQEKSVFCRISGGRERDMNLRYYPIRFTPYLMKVRDPDNTEGQPCCLLIAEKIHSGYEAPRIPPDKRIFTTRHTPSCIFQDVDERAVPLLGYLPQDLVGMPVLFFIHPEDRPLMLAIHKKVLQQAGQPFDHSPIRLCARSGEYVTIDTSWSSFVNPWSRKVSFILGRHKVRTSPLNEDVFTAPKGAEMKPLDPDIQELSEQIHRILMQPVHNTNSGGNGSGGSNTSQEPFHCNASSSDSNAMVTEDATDPKPMTFQEFCQNVHKVKSQGQQMFLGSRVIRPHQRGHFQALAPPRTVLTSVDNTPPDTVPSRTPCVPEELARKETSNYSYQQINCLDSIVRYLESCNLPSTVKRKCGSSSYTSSTSEEEKQKTGESDKEDPSNSPPQRPELPPAPTPTAVGSAPLAPLPPLPPSKAESVVSITSQGSFSSTIVHVGDKKPPDSGEMVPLEEPSCPAAPAPPLRPLGLTKEVLSAHTQREEQAFLTRVQSLSQLRVFDPIPVGVWDEQSQRVPRGTKPSLSHKQNNSSANPPIHSKEGTNTGGRRSKSRKSKAKRPKKGKFGLPSSIPHHEVPPLLPPPPPGMPTYPLPMFPPRAPVPEPTPSLPRYPMVTPIVALVLPNYLFQSPPVAPPFYPGASGFPPFNPTPETPTAASEAPPPTPAPPPAQPMATCPPPSRSSSPPQRLFPSRCSSPLQLDLLQMEELPQPSSGAGAAAVDWEIEEDNKGGVVPGNAVGPNAVPSNGEDDRQPENCMGDPQESSSHNDALSSSSDLLDLLLLEDSCSGTGSAASGSMGSNGGSTSACGTRSSESSNTSKYFGSIDSSETDLRVKKAEREQVEQKVIRYVMQDPLWLLMANADHEVMMSYQLPSRDLESVLREDREKLRQLQRNQPKFSEEQKRELGEVHSWVRKGRLPHVVNITSCTGCSPDYEEDLDMSIMMEGVEEPTEEAVVIG